MLAAYRRHCSRRTAYRLLIIVDEKNKLLLKAKLEVDGEGRLFQAVRDATTLGTFWASCMDMGALIVEAQASSPRAHIAITSRARIASPRAASPATPCEALARRRSPSS